jgi:hypothetical protein
MVIPYHSGHGIRVGGPENDVIRSALIRASRCGSTRALAHSHAATQAALMGMDLTVESF